MPQDQPNIVVVFMDDMGYGDMGCFGFYTGLHDLTFVRVTPDYLPIQNL